MRRREKFVICSILLSGGLLALQYINLELRYFGVAALMIVSYLVSAWALSDDLQRHELLTILPFPALYTAAVGLFYFLLPANLLTKVIILVLFAVGMYGLYLTSNIFSVAKGRTIQLLHAAHASGLLMTLLTSLFLTNTLFSLRFPWYVNGIATGIIHFPLITMSLWSVELESRVSKRVWNLSLLLTLFLMELAVILSFYPLSVWNIALFIMAVLYIGVGIFHNFLRERLFARTLTEFTLVAAFVCVLFVILFPLK